MIMKKMNKKGAIAISEILILITAVFAFAFMVSLSVGVVGGEVEMAESKSISDTPVAGGSSPFSKWLGIKDPGKGVTEVDFFSWQTGSGWDAIISGAGYALVAYGVVQMVGSMVGLDKPQQDAASAAAAWLD